LKDSGAMEIEDFNDLFAQAELISPILFSILKTTRINK